MITHTVLGELAVVGLAILAAVPALLVGGVIGGWLTDKAFRATRAFRGIREEERLERMWQADQPKKRRRAA